MVIIILVYIFHLRRDKMTYYFVIPTGSEYGIKIVVTKTVRNISPREGVVRLLADTLNSAGVEAEQFDDVLENFLADYETF